jgi:glycosyltransferase involved in cell wall biosynthesis
MSDSVLLLSPSRGLGGGIERFVATIEAAFTQHAVRYRRLDLLEPGEAAGARARLRFVGEVTRAARAGGAPVRLVLAHRNLLPVIYPVAMLADFRGATVILHGREIWSGRRSWRHRALRRPDVRAVAASSFSAGALMRTCRAGVLHPGVSAAWYRTLVEAGQRAKPIAGQLNVVTAFRLADWRCKGLDILLEAVRLLGDERVRVTVCGTGPVPQSLWDQVAPHPWCRIAADLDDSALAGRLAAADVFVLSSRTRTGPRAYGEGFGLVLLEAQLAGTPVVAPAYGGSSDAFLPGITGLAPLDETPRALADVLAALSRDESRRAEMSRMAAAWSRRRFEPTVYSRQIVQALMGHALVEMESPMTVRSPQ